MADQNMGSAISWPNAGVADVIELGAVGMGKIDSPAFPVPPVEDAMKQNALAKYPVISLVGVLSLVALAGVFASSGPLRWLMGAVLAGAFVLLVLIPQARQEIDRLLDVGENDDEYIGPPERNPANLTPVQPSEPVKAELSRRRNQVDPANAPRRRKTDRAPLIVATVEVTPEPAQAQAPAEPQASGPSVSAA